MPSPTSSAIEKPRRTGHHEALDLLRQRHLEQPNLDLGFFFRHRASKAGRRDGVMPSDKAMRN
jgi:hypothetical protein